MGSSLIATSCSKEKAKLSGRLVGIDNSNLYLEQVLPGTQAIVDSTTTDDKGKFKFNVKLPQGEPTIFNLRSGSESITLLISPKEKVKIHSVGSIASNYAVNGSPESERLRELKTLMGESSNKIDSILTAYGSTTDTERKKELSSAYASAYVKAKQDHVKFIVTNPASLSSLYALYQRLPNDNTLFDGENDIIYYQAVADSISQILPSSPYVKALQQEIASAKREVDLTKALQEKIDNLSEVTFPDIYLPDMYNEMFRLSDLAGNVILLDFWSVRSNDSRLNNADLKQLFDKYSHKGLKVYQVSVDDEAAKPMWVRAVQEQKLPWISVCDFRGGSSTAVLSYNVQSVPMNFLIDRDGNIVAKNLYGNELTAKVAQLLGN